MESILIPRVHFTDMETEAQEGNGLTQGHLVVFNLTILESKGRHRGELEND